MTGDGRLPPVVSPHLCAVQRNQPLPAGAAMRGQPSDTCHGYPRKHSADFGCHCRVKAMVTGKCLEWSWPLVTGSPAMRRVAAIVSLALLVTASQVCTADISGLAFVQDNGSLRIGRRTIHLFGVYIPPTSTACRSFDGPVKCAPRAALALDFKIRGFVHCDERAASPDGGVIAVCWTGRTPLSEGEDLGAYLLRKGWAAALPEAPVEYQVMERVARVRRLGIWGFALGDSF